MLLGYCYSFKDNRIFDFTKRLLDLVVLNVFTIGLFPAKMGTEINAISTINRRIIRVTTWINFLVNSLPIGIAMMFHFNFTSCKEFLQFHFIGYWKIGFGYVAVFLLIIGLLSCVIAEIYLCNTTLSSVLHLQEDLKENETIELNDFDEPEDIRFTAYARP